MEGRSTLSELLSRYDDWAKSFSTGKLPHLWKLANITPLFKKGSKTDRNNYRQISLTSIVCKIAEKIVKSRVMGFWRNINILDPFAPEPPLTARADPRPLCDVISFNGQGQLCS